jgi:ribosomal 50S subunit-recycling heat shock protein
LRLDKFLKVSRILKRRTVAHDACEGGRVAVNDKPAKPAHTLKTGDVVKIGFGDKKLVFRVLELKEHAFKEDASSMYEILESGAD